MRRFVCRITWQTRVGQANGALITKTAGYGSIVQVCLGTVMELDPGQCWNVLWGIEAVCIRSWIRTDVRRVMFISAV